MPFDEEAFKRQAELAATNKADFEARMLAQSVVKIKYECPKCLGDEVFFGKRKVLGFFRKFPLCKKCDEIMDVHKSTEI